MKKGTAIKFRGGLDFDQAQDALEEDSIEAHLQAFRRCQMKEGPAYDPMTPKYEEAKKFFEEIKSKLDLTFDEAVIFNTTRDRSKSIRQHSVIEKIVQQQPIKKKEYDEAAHNLLRIDHLRQIQAKMIDGKKEKTSRGRSYKFFKGLLKQKDTQVTHAKNNQNDDISDQSTPRIPLPRVTKKTIITENEEMNEKPVENYTAENIYRKWQRKAMTPEPKKVEVQPINLPKKTKMTLLEEGLGAITDRFLHGPALNKDKRKRSQLDRFSRRTSRFSIGSFGNSKSGDRSFAISLLGNLARRLDSAHGVGLKSASKFKENKVLPSAILEMKEDNSTSRISFGDSMTKFINRIEKKPSLSALARSPSKLSNRSISETASRVERDLSTTKLEDILKKPDRNRSETPNKSNVQEDAALTKKDNLDYEFSPSRNKFLGISKKTDMSKIVNFRKRQFNYFHNQAIASLNRAIVESQEAKLNTERQLEDLSHTLISERENLTPGNESSRPGLSLRMEQNRSLSPSFVEPNRLKLSSGGDLMQSHRRSVNNLRQIKRYENALKMISDKNYYYLNEELRFLKTIRNFLENGDTIDKNRFKQALASVSIEGVHEEPFWSVAKIIREDPLIKISDSEYEELMEAKIAAKISEQKKEQQASSQEARRRSWFSKKR